MPKFNIEIRDPQFKRVGRFEQYAKFEAIIRYCDVGTWTMDVDAGLPESKLLVPGGGIIVWAEGLDNPLFSGPVKSIERKWDESNPGELVTFSGSTDELWLNERVIYPDPFSLIGDQVVDRQSGTISAAGALAYLTHYNIGPGALPDRIHPYVIVDDVDEGPTFSLSARFDPLGEYLQKIALSTGYGYQMIHNDENIRFRIFKPVDRSKTVIFSPDLGNLIEYNYRIKAPEATSIIIASQGEGKARYLKMFKADSNGPTMVNDHNTAITYTGVWTYGTDAARAGNYNNDGTYTTVDGASAEMVFTGTGIDCIFEFHPTFGNVEIYIDNVSQGIFSTTGAIAHQQTVYSTTSLTPGAHIVRIVKRSGSYIVFDAFKVTSPPISTSQDWSSFSPERFVDRRDLPIKRSTLGTPIHPETNQPVTPAVLFELEQAGTEAVLEAAGVASLSVTPIDTETIRFGRDYQLGDIVSVSISGVSFTDILREVRLVDSIGDGASVHPVVGTADGGETPYLYKKVKELETAIKRLEARF